MDTVRRPLADGASYLAFRHPEDLLDPRMEAWRDAVVEASSAAFGTDMSDIWAARFAGTFLSGLHRFVLVLDADDNLVGSTGYRATTIDGQRMVYFESASVIPSYRGHGVVLQLQLDALAYEATRTELPVWLVGRTRNPVALSAVVRRYGNLAHPGLAKSIVSDRQALFAETTAWLGFSGYDKATGRVLGAYAGRPPMYPIGEEPVSSDAAANEFIHRLGPTDAVMFFVGPNAHLA